MVRETARVLTGSTIVKAYRYIEKMNNLKECEFTKNCALRLDGHFDSLFKYAPIGIFIMNPSGEILMANRHLEKMFMYSSQELIHEKIEKLFPIRTRNKYYESLKYFIKKLEKNKEGIKTEQFGQKKSGVVFPIQISISQYYIRAESFFIVFVTDITKERTQKQKTIDQHKINKESENQKIKELTRTTSVLKMVNHRHDVTMLYKKAILDNIGVMLFLTDKNGSIKFFNPHAAILSGYSMDEIINKKSPDIFFSKEEISFCRQQFSDSTSFKKDIDVILAKSSKGEIIDMECSLVTKNNTTIPVSTTITPIKDKQNEITGFLGLIKDISIQKDTTKILSAALEKEKELGSLKSKFVTMASHEFRTPLSTILSSTYLALQYLMNEEPIKTEKHLQRVIQSVNLLTDILNDFLSVGRIEEGKILVRLEDFNIKKSVEKTIVDLSQSVKKGQKIKYEHQGNLIAHLDQSLFKNILNNLLSNAIKFSPDKSQIEIKTAVKESQTILEIKDNGIGISIEDQAHLMERFFRGANAINIQGTGLGMHIVSKYVERLNGTISFTSEINKGTTFRIVFNNIFNHLQ